MKYGFYSCEPWTPATRAQAALNQVTDLIQTADAGATLIHFSHLGDVAHSRKLLHMARIRGIGVIFEDLIEPDLSALASHPALLMLNVQDDANEQPLPVVANNASAGEVLPRYLSMWPTEQDPRPELYSLTEAVGVQSYVYPGWLMSSYLVWSAARTQADQNSTYLIGNAQLHNFGPGLPTPDQIRAQVWVAAAVGCNALLGYALRSSSGVILPQILQAYASACREVQGLLSRAVCVFDGQHNRLIAHWPQVQVVIDLTNMARVISIT